MDDSQPMTAQILPEPVSPGNKAPADHNWQLSEALYTALHQWPLILAFCLLGALLGWGASFIWPRTFRTRAEIYVSLNPYRAYSDSQFLALAYPQYSNIDDYKNWQMSQLSGAIFTPEIIQEALDKLRQEDPYWNDVEIDDLSSMLRAEWRTAGIWSLLADSRSAKRSNQAVRAWSRTAVSRIKQAVSASERLFQVDEVLRVVYEEQSRTALQVEEYKAVQSLLQDWLSSAPDLPPDQPLSTAERGMLLYLAGRSAQFTPAWTELLESAPVATALPAETITWAEQVLLAIETELPLLSNSLDVLNQQHELLSAEYEKQAAQSLGLSSNLVVKGLEKTLPEINRPTALMALAGTICGLLAWIVWVFASLNRQKLRAEEFVR